MNGLYTAGGTMRFFASWWERFPVRVQAAAPTVVAIAFGFGVVSYASHLIRVVAGATGFSWG
jgi:hypothetical protein